MKLTTAIDMGTGMGLKTPEECINNILIHAMMIFPYSVLDVQIDELLQDARKAGIKFGSCGCATTGLEDEYCPTCKKLSELKNDTP